MTRDEMIEIGARAEWMRFPPDPRPWEEMHSGQREPFLHAAAVVLDAVSVALTGHPFGGIEQAGWGEPIAAVYGSDDYYPWTLGTLRDSDFPMPAFVFLSPQETQP